MVELELAFPFSNQTPFPVGVSNGVVGLANVFGFATTLYFCIPDNPQLTGAAGYDRRPAVQDPALPGHRRGLPQAAAV